MTNIIDLSKIPEDQQTEELCLLAVQQNGLLLQFVKKQTTEICLAAVKQEGYSLQYVEKQSPEVCLAAVSSDGGALQFVKDQTQDICIAAVSEGGDALRHVKNQTPEICLAAVKQDGRALKYVKNQTEEMCFAAVKTSTSALQYVKNQTPEICLAAVNSSGHSLFHVENQTQDLCLAAVKQEPSSIIYVKSITKEIILEAVKSDCNIKFSSLFAFADLSDIINIQNLDGDIFINMSDSGVFYCIDKKIISLNSDKDKKNQDPLIAALAEKINSSYINDKDLLDISKRYRIISEVLYELDFSYVEKLKVKSPELFENNIYLSSVYEKIKIESYIFPEKELDSNVPLTKAKKF